jgi:hypothetical protein
MKKIPPPNYIKIDIEGGEYLALKAARRLLSEFKPVIFLSTHSPEIHKECCDILTDLGYDLTPVNKNHTMDEADELIAFCGC